MISHGSYIHGLALYSVFTTQVGRRCKETQPFEVFEVATGEQAADSAHEAEVALTRQVQALTFEQLQTNRKSPPSQPFDAPLPYKLIDVQGRIPAWEHHLGALQVARYMLKQPGMCR